MAKTGPVIVSGGRSRFIEITRYNGRYHQKAYIRDLDTASFFAALDERTFGYCAFMKVGIGPESIGIVKISSN